MRTDVVPSRCKDLLSPETLSQADFDLHLGRLGLGPQNSAGILLGLKPGTNECSNVFNAIAFASISAYGRNDSGNEIVRSFSHRRPKVPGAWLTRGRLR